MGLPEGSAFYSEFMSGKTNKRQDPVQAGLLPLLVKMKSSDRLLG